MKRLVVLVIASLVVFALLRIMSVIIAFLFGIGASAPSERYTPYILVPALIFQLVLTFILYRKRKFIETGFQMFFLIAMVIVLFIVGKLGLIPF